MAGINVGETQKTGWKSGTLIDSMKTLLLFILSLSYASAAIVSTATCQAFTPVPAPFPPGGPSTKGPAIFDVSNPNACAGLSNAPDAGYRLAATVSSGGLPFSGALETIALNGLSTGIQPIVYAAATKLGSDTVTFPGSGPATLRVTLHLHSDSFDRGGTVAVAVNGSTFERTADSFTPSDIVVNIDFKVDLGTAFAFSVLGRTVNNPIGPVLGGPRSQFTYSVRQFRLYDASGAQIHGVTGTGIDVPAYDLFYEAGDVSTGPLLASIPEPKTNALAFAGLAMAYWVRKLKLSSAEPQVR